MKEYEKFFKVRSIIKSCRTIAQLESCLSFIERPEFFKSTVYKFATFITLQDQLEKLNKYSND